jgi:hypothetical protein
MLLEGGGRRPAVAAIARSQVTTARASIHTPATAAPVRSMLLGLDLLPHDLPTHTHTQREGVRLEESHAV